jgi:predicted enzyme related to lactoylglutathione lyase
MEASIAAGAVVYAKNLARMSAFYEQVTGLPVTHFHADYAVLQSGAVQLVVHSIPAHIAASITVADPPARREDTAVKLMFVVPSIAQARALAASLGGELNPPDREWQFGAYRVCDGHDTEGNVIQLRQHAP